MLPRRSPLPSFILVVLTTVYHKFCYYCCESLFLRVLWFYVLDLKLVSNSWSLLRLMFLGLFLFCVWSALRNDFRS
jgi:hypothetical protein